MPSNKSFLLLLKAFAISLPIYLLTIGGVFAIPFVVPFLNSRASFLNVDRGEFSVMTLVNVDIASSINPLETLIGFGIVFLLTWGAVALPNKGRIIAVVSLCTLIIGLWISVGFLISGLFNEIPFPPTH